MAVICPSCGAPAVEDDRFCHRCGATLGDEPTESRRGSGFCTSCGNPLDDGDRFCGSCGAEIRVSGRADEEIAGVPLINEDEDDLFSEWDFPESSPDSAPTETIVRARRAHQADTAVLSRPAPAAPGPGEEAPPPGPEARPPGPRPPFPLGAAIALLGAVAVILSSILEWGGPFDGSFPRDIPVRLLLDPEGPTSGPSLGIVLLVMGTFGALMALLSMAVPSLTFVRRLIGVLSLMIPAGFALRTLDPLLADGVAARLPDFLAAGVYMAVGGAIVQLVAGRRRRR